MVVTSWSHRLGEPRIHHLHEIIDQRMSLILLFVAFITTFLTTRTITRLIRAGKGPFRNNVQGGVHIHHAVPGIVLLVVGGISSVASAGRSPGAGVSAVLIGIGASLVLDEFALILHLQDVYWSREGQLSVQVVGLAAAAMGLLVLGIQPFTFENPSPTHAVFVMGFVVHIFCLLVCIAKGKYSRAVLGAFLPPVAWWGAVRLAQPRSRWARRYSPEKLARSTKRYQEFSKRWGGWGLGLEDLVAGAPTAAKAPPSGG